MKENFKSKKPRSQTQKMKVSVISLFVCFIANPWVTAQVKTISGHVKSTSGEELPGVSIVVKGTANGTTSDADGSYSISNISPSATLIFSYIGMESKEVSIGNQSVIDVIMNEDLHLLEEVVIVGYGTMMKKDLTGAVTSVNGNILAERGTTRVSQSLQGSMPGVMVTRSGNASDASATIKVRGITTIGDSNPLVIIDGIPGTLDWVNPNDIENISVLKDAASASIYGSRAAAGVILVTTKRAKSGQLNLTYNYEYAIDKPTRVAKHADAQTYMRIHNEKNWNDNDNTGSEYPVYTKDLIDNYGKYHAENPDQYPDNDWLTSMVKNYAPRQTHNLNLTAGAEKIKTSISFVYDQTDGLYVNKSYDRLTYRANNDIVFNNYLSMEVDLNGIYSVNKNPIGGVSNTSGCAPVYAMQWSDGRVGSGKSGVNIWARLHEGGISETIANVTGGKIALNLTPIKGLKISGIFSPEYYTGKTKSFTKKIPYTDWDNSNNIVGYIENHTKTYLSEGRTENVKTTTQALANYINSFNQHNINLTAGYENYYYKSESTGASRDQYALTSFPYLDLGNENYQYNSGNAFQNAYRSFFGRVMYNYAHKYYFQANARYDGSSRFHKEHRWGLFPSFSTGWVLTEERFMKKVPILSFLKLRASWGSLGNERIGNYPYQSTISFDNALFFQGNNVTSAQTSAIQKYAIQDISWEKTETYDIGLDFKLFNNRLTFTGDYYKKKTRDMLLALAIPEYIGLDNPDQNTGKMHTTGWEFEIGWYDRIGELNYSVSANLSDFKSVMGDLGGTEFLGNQVKFKGSQFNEWYGYKSDGLYQTQEEVENSATLNANVKPGDIKYIDISGPDGVPDGKISSEYDRVLLGGSLPRYMYGGNIRLDWKGIDFSLTVQGIGKQLSQITTSMVQPFRAEFIEVPKLIVGKYWSTYHEPEQNLKAKYPRVSSKGNANNYNVFSDYWLMNGSYFRLKNITLGYTIPKKALEKVKLRNLRVYASANDLFSIDHFPDGWDPEAPGYWVAKSFILGISLNF